MISLNRTIFNFQSIVYFLLQILVVCIVVGVVHKLTLLDMVWKRRSFHLGTSSNFSLLNRPLSFSHQVQYSQFTHYVNCKDTKINFFILIVTIVLPIYICKISFIFMYWYSIKPTSGSEYLIQCKQPQFQKSFYQYYFQILRSAWCPGKLCYRVQACTRQHELRKI